MPTTDIAKLGASARAGRFAQVSATHRGSHIREMLQIVNNIEAIEHERGTPTDATACGEDDFRLTCRRSNRFERMSQILGSLRDQSRTNEQLQVVPNGATASGTCLAFVVN